MIYRTSLVFLVLVLFYFEGRWMFYGGMAYVNERNFTRMIPAVRNTIHKEYDLKFGITKGQFAELVDLIDADLLNPVSGGMGYEGFASYGRESIGLVGTYECPGVIVNDDKWICDFKTHEMVQSKLFEFAKQNNAVRSLRATALCLALRNSFTCKVKK